MRFGLDYDNTYKEALASDNPIYFIEKRWGDSTPYYIQFVEPYVLNRFDMDIMEIGAGFGRYTRHVLSVAKNIYAVDISDISRAFIAKVFTSKVLPMHPNHIHSIPDDSIDLVFSFSTMLHFNRDDMIWYLDRVPSKMKIGSHFILHYMDAATGKCMLDNKRYEFYNENELVDMYKTYGLTAIKAETPHKTIIAGHRVIVFRRQ